MLYILSKSINPYFNLATEEFLLKNRNEDIFMLWRSEPSVIIGKHQNAPAETNIKFCNKNNIQIARRLSGGGTVVHDLNNLNFTFIRTGEEGKLVDFKRFVNPIIDYLATLGIKAHIGKTNDIRIDELKVSGNAEHVYRRRTLHHGTLLFKSDLSRLRKAIEPSKATYTDKAVQSNRASVTNIAEFLKEDMNIEDFTTGLCSFIINANNAKELDISPNDLQKIEKLATEKYKTWEWIWGYSPSYQFKHKSVQQENNIDIYLEVSKGLIKSSEIKSDIPVLASVDFTGIKHDYKSILNYLLNLQLPQHIIPENLAYAFF